MRSRIQFAGFASRSNAYIGRFLWRELMPNYGRATRRLWCQQRRGRESLVSASIRILAGLVVAAGIANSAHGQDPAVSALNGKIGFRGGYAEYSGDRAKGPTALLEGSLTAPLGHLFGLQLDGALGELAGRNFASIGGHAFWRDPAVGLFGLVGQFAAFSGATAVRFGAEGELYVGRLSLATRLLYQTGRRNANRTILIGRGFHGTGEVRWYPEDDLMFKLGAGIGPLLNHSTYQGVFLAGAEWQPRIASVPGLSLLANGEVESRGDFRVSVGIRLYLGGNDPAKTLIRRHREDDPIPIGTETGQAFQQGNPKGPKPEEGCPPNTFAYMGQCLLED